MSDVVAGNLAFIVYKRLAPNLGVNFIVGLQVFADVVLVLSNKIQLLLAMDVHSRCSLTKQRRTLVFAKLLSHF